MNKSNAIGVGTGGIIGMNESEKDMSYLVNGAFVGRQISKVDTNRFAGGIIGNQNNTTSSDCLMEQFIAITPIIQAVLWDSGPVQAERFRTV